MDCPNCGEKYLPVIDFDGAFEAWCTAEGRRIPLPDLKDFKDLVNGQT